MFKIGHIPWNKGLKEWNSGEKHPRGMLGKVGIYHHTDKTKERLSILKMGDKNPNYKKYRVPVKICNFCGKEFRSRERVRKFCSKLCVDASRRGKHFYLKPKNQLISSLVERIRKSIEYKEWRRKIFERDNYTCRECFKRSGVLHPHHIKPFSVIFREFLFQYNQFSYFDDKDVLLRLSFNYKDFWNIDNGITLCKKCHKETKTYGGGLKICLEKF